MQHNCPVPILQNEWEFNQLLYLYKELKPKTVIEIGSFFGGTLFHWIKENNNIQTIFTIDLPIPKIDHRYYQMIDCRNKWGEWIGNSIRHFDIRKPSQDTSAISEVRSGLNNELADFLFIDGSHEYEDVRKDFDNYSPFIREGGIIALHDISYSPGVSMYWQELKAVSGYNTIEVIGSSRADMPERFGIGIIVK